MTRNLDELNNLKTKKVKEPEEYFGEMDIPEEDKEERINFANEAKELFDVILILLLTMRDRGEVNYLYARELLETWLISLINKFVEPDDYTIDFASETAYNFVDTTKKHIDEDRFFSEDRAIINAENSANAIIEYKRYIEALSKGKTEKEWVTKRDNKERESHKIIDGTRIGILKTFDVGGVPMRFPMDTLYGDAPQETVNCRCHCDYYPKDDKKVEKNDDSKQNRIEKISSNDIIGLGNKIESNQEKKLDNNSDALPDKRSGQLLIEASSPFANPNTSLEIYEYDQSKHYRGGKKYLKYMETHEFEPSYLTITLEMAQELVNKYHGKGVLTLNKNGDILPKEFIIDYDGIVGNAVNDLNGKEAETSGFMIIYSNKGTHIAPTFMSKKLYLLEQRKKNGYDWLYRQKS